MNEKKLLIIASLLAEVHHPLLRFFDFESEEMLDDKIQVLTDLKNGKTISEIPKFYDILELYPDENEDSTLTYMMEVEDGRYLIDDCINMEYIHGNIQLGYDVTVYRANVPEGVDADDDSIDWEYVEEYHA